MDPGFKTLIFFLLLCQMNNLTSGANILAFYPFPGISHHKVYWPVLRELANRGHNVTLVSPFSMANPPKNYKEIKVPNYAQECRDLELEPSSTDSTPLARWWKDTNVILVREMGIFLVKTILQDPAVQGLIASDSKFDVILGEFAFAEESFIALAHRFQTSYVELTSFGNYHWSYWMYGNALDTSYMADVAMAYSDKMSFTEKFHNTLHSSFYRLLWYYFYLPMYQQLADSYIRYPGWETRPSISDMLSRNTSMILMNTHYSVNYPTALAPHFKEIGGVNLQGNNEPLPKGIQEFMDGAKEGVIYFSLGSYLQGNEMLNQYVRDDFIRVFSGLKQRVLWKWEASIPNLPPNIMIGKWMPQPSILAHPKCKLFISHSGFLSITETVNNAVPVLALPVFADQFRNARFVASSGIGITMDLANLTKESISWAIGEVINNPRYKQEVLKRSKIFQDKPETALQTAVYWIEYVIRHKGAHHLKPAIATIPWYQQAMIDVYGVIATITLICLYTIYKLAKSCCRCICGGKNNKATKKVKTQ